MKTTNKKEKTKMIIIRLVNGATRIYINSTRRKAVENWCDGKLTPENFEQMRSAGEVKILCRKGNGIQANGQIKIF
jgi:hypothetical protein